MHLLQLQQVPWVRPLCTLDAVMHIVCVPDMCCFLRGSHKAIDEQQMRESLLREVESAIRVSGTTDVPTMFFGGGEPGPSTGAVSLL